MIVKKLNISARVYLDPRHYPNNTVEEVTTGSNGAEMFSYMDAA